MEIIDNRIDAGKAFDWGRTSPDYAKYRDIYPEQFYEKIIERGLCIQGQNVLDIGTGTGVVPLNMYKYGAKWTGIDISQEQIDQAKYFVEKNEMNIDFYAVSAEKMTFPSDCFDVITACQCFWYFDHEKIMPELARMLKSDGRLVILYMAWLPEEDEIAGESEKTILKYSPDWSGAGEYRHRIWLPEIVNRYFVLEDHEEYDLYVPFTKESWHGRMKASRGVGASLSAHELAKWDEEHRTLLERIAPERFNILHYAAISVLHKKNI